MRLTSVVTRLKARWRLHRMEWDAMHRPLLPPRGYEHFFTEDSVFPGLRRTQRRKETLEDHFVGISKAWKIYRHDFVYDPEVAMMERQIGLIDDKKAEENAAVILGRAKRSVARGLSTADGVLDAINNKAPDAQRLVNYRINVLAEAINEFSKGYAEGVEGKFTFWDEDDDEKRIEHSFKSINDIKESHGQARYDRD